MKNLQRKVTTIVLAISVITIAGCYAEPDYSHYDGPPRVATSNTNTMPPPNDYGPHYRSGPMHDAGAPPPRTVVSGQGQAYSPGPTNGPGYSPE